MPECTNPLWPCAMTGAAACLAGFEGIAVVIHGSSGCYFYPATLLHAPLSGTFILENEVIFGSETRLLEVLDGIEKTGKKVAVVTTCVPAVLGEDIRAILSEHDVILVDSPGFSGSFEAGYKVALSALKPATDPEIPGVTVDGLSLFDPFYQGNILEMKRLLALAGVSSYTLLCADRFSNLRHVSANTISTNEDLASGIGTSLGTVLGFDCIQETFEAIGRLSDTADPDPVIHEIVHAEERLVSACDKYLRRFDPPAVAVFSGFSYASFAARCIEKYLDAEIACIGSRTDLLRPLPWRSEKVMGLTEVEELIRVHQPDLVIGSSFERSVKGPAGFVGLTPPLRGTVRLSSRPVIGTEGVLTLMESVLNACMDRRIQSR